MALISTPTKHLVASLFAGAMLAACGGSGDVGAGPSGAEPPAVATTSSGISADVPVSANVAYYAREFDVSEAEARDYVEDIPTFDPSLLEVEGKTLAVWLERVPEPHIVVAVVGDDIGMEAAYEAAKAMPLPVEFRFGEPYTQDEINDIADQALKSLGPDPGAAGIGYLPMEGHIWLSLQPFSRYANQDASMSAILTARFGFPFKVETSTTIAGDG